MSNQKNLGLTLAVIFAGVAISGSLIFFGVQYKNVGKGTLSDDALTKKIAEGVETYINAKIAEQQKQEAAANDPANAKKKYIVKAGKVKPVSKKDDHIKGSTDTPISLVEYSDFECPFCKGFHQSKTLDKLVEKYNGKVNWVYRHYPLDFHNPEATNEAEAAECANEVGGNEKFWQYAELVYERTGSNKQGIQNGTVQTLAKEIGLNEKKFQACLDGDKFLAKIQDDTRFGTEAGVTGTPGTIILNNATGEGTLIKGGQPISWFEEEIEKMMK